MKSVWHACGSFMSVCFIYLEKWINIMQGFRELRNPVLTWDIYVIVWRYRYHDMCENLWPLLLHGEDSHWICYKIFRFHKSTKVNLKILQCFSRMISVITMIWTKYVLNTGSEICQTIMLAAWLFCVKQSVFICALQITQNNVDREKLKCSLNSLFTVSTPNPILIAVAMNSSFHSEMQATNCQSCGTATTVYWI